MFKIPSNEQWVDLTNRVKAKQDALTAGSGIDITGATVSTDGVVFVDESKPVTDPKMGVVSAKGIEFSGSNSEKRFRVELNQGENKIELHSQAIALDPSTDAWTTTSFSPVVSLTKAEYEALPFNVQMNGTTYYITDVDPNYTPSGSLVVDPGLSSVSENPVQNRVVNAAIEDLNSRVAALEALLSGYGDVELQMGDGVVTVNKLVLAKNTSI